LILQLEHEIRGEAFLIPFDRLKKALHADAVKIREFRVENDALATQQQNGAGYSFLDHRTIVWHLGHTWVVNRLIVFQHESSQRAPK
jgi:hypothetical protein